MTEICAIPCSGRGLSQLHKAEVVPFAGARYRSTATFTRYGPSTSQNDLTMIETMAIVTCQR